MDYAKINEAAMGYKDDMTKFLRDLVRIPGESCGEKGHIMRIKEEMEKSRIRQSPDRSDGQYPRLHGNR